MSKKVLKKNQQKEKRSSVSKVGFLWKLLGILFLLFLLYIVFKGMTGNFVYGSFEYQLDNAISQVQPFFQALFGGENYTSQLLFEKFLFFLLILGFVFIVLKPMPLFNGQKNILVVVSIVVSILSVRYINYEWLMTMIMTYSVFGVALISFLPFVIFFFFLQGVSPNSSTVRKIGWILFACIYFGLWYSAENPFYAKVYAWTGLASLIFLLADGTIHKYLKMERIKAMGKNSIDEAETEFRRRIYALQQDLTNGIITRDFFNRKMKDYEDRIKSLHKYS